MPRYGKANKSLNFNIKISIIPIIVHYIVKTWIAEEKGFLSRNRYCGNIRVSIASCKDKISA